MDNTFYGCLGFNKVANIKKEEDSYLVNLSRLDGLSLNRKTYVNPIKRQILEEYVNRNKVLKCGYQLNSIDIKERISLNDLASLNNENFCGILKDIHTRNENRRQYIYGYFRPYGPKSDIAKELLSSPENELKFSILTENKKTFDPRNQEIIEIVNLVGFSLTGKIYQHEKPKIGTFRVVNKEDEFV